MSYDDDPRLESVALTSEDVEALLLTDGASIAAHPRRVRHLLSRMRATFAHNVEQTRALHRDVARMQEAARVRSTPVAHALEVLGKLTLEEQQTVYSRRGRVLLDALNEARAQTVAARVAAASETNRARFVLSSLLESSALSPADRELVNQALAALPARIVDDGVAVVALDTPVPGEFSVAPAAVHDDG